ncbi:MAG: hypothetical protein ACK5VD_11505, partial [Aphanizomenon sp.]
PSEFQSSITLNSNCHNHHHEDIPDILQFQSSITLNSNCHSGPGKPLEIGDFQNDLRGCSDNTPFQSQEQEQKTL